MLLPSIDHPGLVQLVQPVSCFSLSLSFSDTMLLNQSASSSGGGRIYKFYFISMNFIMNLLVNEFDEWMNESKANPAGQLDWTHLLVKGGGEWVSDGHLMLICGFIKNNIRQWFNQLTDIINMKCSLHLI